LADPLPPGGRNGGIQPDYETGCKSNFHLLIKQVSALKQQIAT
jgi:hypothetical protein